MPYVARGKCVYKRDTGAKVGCTKGSVKKYLAALHANVKTEEEQPSQETGVEILAVSGRMDLDQNILDQEDNIVNKTGIRPSFDKEISYIAIDGDALVGILWTVRNKEKVELDIAIDPDYQSKKIGSRMIYDQLKDWKQESMDMKTTIEINCVNPRLKEWLLKNGFKQHKMYPSYVVKKLSEQDIPINNSRRIMLNGKQIDPGTIEIEGVDMRDYPDFSDAFISYACFADGTELTDAELEQLNNQEGELVNDLARDHSIRDIIKNTIKEVLGVSVYK
jgi:GNAT superfamily N-acetyltransferase